VSALRPVGPTVGCPTDGSRGRRALGAGRVLLAMTVPGITSPRPRAADVEAVVGSVRVVAGSGIGPRRLARVGPTARAILAAAATRRTVPAAFPARAVVIVPVTTVDAPPVA